MTFCMIMKNLPTTVFFMFTGAIALAQDGALPEDVDVTEVPEALIDLPTFGVWEQRVANPQPVATFPMPVSALRFEPQVDVQERGTSEAQADVSIRGGIFENTGFILGAATLYDPQTGHYFAEIPVSPMMLTNPRILTGLDNAVSGFNSTVGSVEWGWLPLLQSGGVIGGGLGNYGLNYQHAYAAYVHTLDQAEQYQLGLDFDFGRSEGNGTVQNGDHNYNRYNARVQLLSPFGQTDAFVGYQSKFFGWPNMYTPFNVPETENLQTLLLLLNHRLVYGDDSYIEATLYYRRNKDNYVFNRFNPGAFQAFHTTWVTAAGVQGLHRMEAFDIRYGGQFTQDDISSTALTFGPYDRRTYYKFSIVPEKTFQLDGPWALTLKAGASLDGDNRNGATGSPLAAVVVRQTVDKGFNEYFAEFTKTTQVPGYTALNSNPAGGLFRGNASLGRERSYQVETGVRIDRGNWQAQGTVFYRYDKDLVDWTFNSAAPNARTANALDGRTFGLEFIGYHRWESVDLIAGYTYLNRDDSYNNAAVDASFYAGNYARHRVTLAGVWRFLEQFELRVDNEFRVQEDNMLRVGTSTPFFTRASLFWFPQQLRGLEISLSLDNIWNTRYQDIPAVPGAGRQFSAGVAYRF
jgi:vitamin B12 transporter